MITLLPPLIALLLGGSWVWAHLYQAQRAYQRQQFAQARFHWERVLIIFPMWANLHASIALMYFREKNHLAGHVALDKALVHNPRCDMAFNVRAWYLTHAGRLTEALNAAQQAVALNATSLHHLDTRAHTYFVAQDYAAAHDDYLTVLDLSPDYPSSSVGLAVTYLALGKAGEAHTTWQRFADHYPQKCSLAALEAEFDFAPFFLAAVQRLVALVAIE